MFEFRILHSAQVWGTIRYDMMHMFFPLEMITFGPTLKEGCNRHVRRIETGDSWEGRLIVAARMVREMNTGHFIPYSCNFRRKVLRPIPRSFAVRDLLLSNLS
jgi:hypothetical protein